MFLLFDERVTPILIEELGMREDMLFEMQYAYVDAVQKLQLNELLAFIEEKGLTEESEKLDSFTDTNLPQEEKVDNLEKLYSYMIEVIEQQPELKQRITEKIKAFEQSTLDDLFSALSEDGLEKIRQLFVDDMQSILELSDKHEEFELPERLKKFRPQE